MRTRMRITASGRRRLTIATAAVALAAFALPVLDRLDLTQKKPQALVLAPTRELAAQIATGVEPISGIPNLWIRNRADGTIEKNPGLPFLQELDTVPFIDRTMWNKWILDPDAGVSILVGRGCPYKCTYCSNHAMNRLASGKFVRYRSPENLIGEIEYVREHYSNTDHIYLEVETITANLKKTFELFAALADYNSEPASER